MFLEDTENLDRVKEKYPEKFVSEQTIFSHIRRGDRIFIGSGCGEPQYLVRALVYLTKRQGLLGFTANILMDNRPMLHLTRKMGFEIEKTGDAGVYDLKMRFTPSS